MPSINLLSKNIKIKEELIKEEKSNVAFIVSFLIVLLPIVLFVGLRINNRYASERISALNSEIEAADKEIKGEVSDNKFLIAEIKAKNNNLLLAKHTYFTKALNLVRSNLIMSVYLDELSISMEGKKEKEKFVVFEFSATAKDYQSIMSQMRIFKNLPDIENVSIVNISTNDEGFENFEGILRFKKEILFYEYED